LGTAERGRGEAVRIVQNRGGRVLGLFSSGRNWDSLTPHLQASLPPPPFGSGEGTLTRGRGVGGVPIPTRGHTLWYRVLFRLAVFLGRAAARCPLYLALPAMVRLVPGSNDLYVYLAEGEWHRFQGAQESIPRNQFSQPM